MQKDVDLADNQARARWTRVAIVTIAATGGAFLLTRHAGHVAQLLPYALLLACPLMHLMHHRRHRHGQARR